MTHTGWYAIKKEEEAYIHTHTYIYIYICIYQSNKKTQSFIHDGTKNIKSKRGDKLADRFHPRSIELNQGKYHVE